MEIQQIYKATFYQVHFLSLITACLVVAKYYTTSRSPSRDYHRENQ